MYDRLTAMLCEIGVDTSQATPQSTFRALQMDSLSLTELAVITSEEFGTRPEKMNLDTTLAQAVEQFTALPRPQEA
jgi:acyl carrier protein